MENAMITSFLALDDLDSAEVSHAPKTFLDAQAQAAGSVNKVKCYSCRGSGKFVSYTGRTVGDCFTCHGTGHTSTKVAKSHATKVSNAQAETRFRKEFREEHTDVVGWLETNSQHNSFASSLLNQLNSRGTLSERQVACVREQLAKSARKREETIQAVIAAEPTGTGLDLSKLPEGYYAVPQGDTRLKVRIQKPTAPSRWAGFVFVSDGAAYGSARKYGRQAPGKSYSGDIVPQLTAILSNPIQACAAYGKLVGRCGVCGRKLEDEESVARGIGPICAGKF